MKENENESAWSLEIGFYTGILIGFRSYKDIDRDIHVLYLPFIDLALTVYK
jgi:hypothetical protein|tara:strand:- start:36 stop:188 length:153 start_codon:yes stop_codon:yes gene_type:complete